MKTLLLCLVTAAMTSGCIIHHTETLRPHDERQDRTRPEGVAFAPAPLSSGGLEKAR
jgi:hypothetical protein